MNIAGTFSLESFVHQISIALLIDCDLFVSYILLAKNVVPTLIQNHRWLTVLAKICLFGMLVSKG